METTTTSSHSPSRISLPTASISSTAQPEGSATAARSQTYSVTNSLQKKSLLCCKNLLKVDGSQLLTFFRVVHFSYDIKQMTSMRWLAIPNPGHSHFPHNFWSSYEYLILCQSEDSCAHLFLEPNRTTYHRCAIKISNLQLIRQLLMVMCTQFKKWGCHIPLHTWIQNREGRSSCKAWIMPPLRLAYSTQLATTM